MTTTSVTLLRVALFAYLAATLVYLAYVTFARRRSVGIVAYTVLAAAFLIHTAFQVIRIIEYWSQHQAFILPAASFIEAVSFCAWTIALVYLVGEWAIKTRLLGAAVSAVLTLLLGYAMLHGSSLAPRPLMPALKSPWLNIHVTTIMLSYAGLLLGSLVAVFYLLRLRGVRWVKSMFGNMTLEDLDLLAYRFIVFAFPLLTLGIITGAIWADQAWGRFWGWDPKETWSLITWLIWAGYLHTRLAFGWRGARSAWFAIVGIISVFITFFGVSFLAAYFSVKSLHTY
jgi:cytochrome c-type biogenesis protein CcsB